MRDERRTLAAARDCFRPSADRAPTERVRLLGFREVSSSRRRERLGAGGVGGRDADHQRRLLEHAAELPPRDLDAPVLGHEPTEGVLHGHE